MAHASVGRHTLLAFERENWSRLPMTLGLAERTRQAGSAAFKMGQFDQAVALYTEALQACAGGELGLAGCEIAAR